MLAVDVVEDDAMGTYVASLVLYLSAESDERAALFSISSREAVTQGFASDRDVGQACLLLWWD